MQSGLVSTNASMVSTRTRFSRSRRGSNEAQEILDAYVDIMFDQLRQTSFDLAMGEFLLDLCVGTAVMMITPGDEVTPISFLAVPQYLVAIEEGAIWND